MSWKQLFISDIVFDPDKLDGLKKTTTGIELYDNHIAVVKPYSIIKFDDERYTDYIICTKAVIELYKSINELQLEFLPREEYKRLEISKYYDDIDIRNLISGKKESSEDLKKLLNDKIHGWKFQKLINDNWYQKTFEYKHNTEYYFLSEKPEIFIKTLNLDIYNADNILNYCNYYGLFKREDNQDDPYRWFYLSDFCREVELLQNVTLLWKAFEEDSFDNILHYAFKVIMLEENRLKYSYDEKTHIITATLHIENEGKPNKKSDKKSGKESKINQEVVISVAKKILESIVNDKIKDVNQILKILPDGKFIKVYDFKTISNLLYVILHEYMISKTNLGKCDECGKMFEITENRGNKCHFCPPELHPYENGEIPKRSICEHRYNSKISMYKRKAIQLNKSGKTLDEIIHHFTGKEKYAPPEKIKQWLQI